MFNANYLQEQKKLIFIHILKRADSPGTSVQTWTRFEIDQEPGYLVEPWQVR